jgi:hypothetical protein
MRLKQYTPLLHVSTTESSFAPTGIFRNAGGHFPGGGFRKSRAISAFAARSSPIFGELTISGMCRLPTFPIGRRAFLK